MALACLGSETDGSIVSPSDVNNLVGIKPSVGLTSRALVIPISEHQDTVGPMARTVKDAAYLLQAIAGKDAADNYTSAIPFDVLPDYVAACNYSALSGKRLGVPRNVIEAFADNSSAPLIAAFNDALKILAAAGATIVDNTNFTGLEPLFNGSFEGNTLDADFLVDLPKYLSQLTYNPTGVTDLASVRDFTIGFPAEDYPDRDVAVWNESLALGFDNTSPKFWESYQQQLYYGGLLGVTGALTNYSLDALLLPTSFASTFPAVIGAPIVTVPLGKYPANATVVTNTRGDLNATAPNVPFGISFFAERFSEAKLIGFGYAFEQRTKVRNTITPYVQPTIELADVISKRRI